MHCLVRCWSWCIGHTWLISPQTWVCFRCDFCPGPSTLSRHNIVSRTGAQFIITMVLHSGHQPTNCICMQTTANYVEIPLWLLHPFLARAWANCLFTTHYLCARTTCAYMFSLSGLLRIISRWCTRTLSAYLHQCGVLCCCLRCATRPYCLRCLLLKCCAKYCDIGPLMRSAEGGGAQHPSPKGKQVTGMHTQCSIVNRACSCARFAHRSSFN